MSSLRKYLTRRTRSATRRHATAYRADHHRTATAPHPQPIPPVSLTLR